MSSKFKTIITAAGAEKFAAATVPGGKKVNLMAMAVGDGGGILPEPNRGQVKLINEVWRHALNKISQDNKNKNHIVAELVIPPEVGGFWARELGLYDDTGTLVAVANMAESYKPELAEGSGRTQTCRMVIIVSSIAAVELSVDSATVMATKDYVDLKIEEHEQSRRHPAATLQKRGFTQLSSETGSASELLAATPKAVKAANDNANGRVPSDRKVNGYPLTDDISITTQDIFNQQVEVIGANQNLDNYQTPGLYVQNDNANAKEALHYPESNAGSLMVLKSAGVTQIYHTSNSSRIWSRSKSSTKGWTPWARQYNTQNKPGADDVGALPITGGKINGLLGIGSQNELGGNSIALGDSKTGFKQAGEGVLNVYANAQIVFRFINTTIESLKSLKVHGHCIAKNEIQAGSGSARLAPDGNLYGAVWDKGWLRDYLIATFQPKGEYTPAGQAYTKKESDARYVQNIRVSAPQEIKFWGGDGWSKNDSAFATAIRMVGGDANVGSLYVRYLQKNINGTWLNVTA